MSNGQPTEGGAVESEDRTQGEHETEPTQGEHETEPTQDPAARQPGSESDEIAEQATPGDQGEQVPVPANAEEAGFDPDRAVRTSPPAPEEQSGVPDLSNGRNEGVEAQRQYAPGGERVDSPQGAEGDSGDDEGEPTAE